MNAALQRKAEEYGQAITCNDHGRAMALLGQFGDVAYQQGVEDTLAEMAKAGDESARIADLLRDAKDNHLKASPEPNVLDALFTDTPPQEANP